MPVHFIKKVALIVFSCLLFSESQAETTISLRSSVKVSHAKVTLDDIADIKSDNMHTLIRLQAIHLGNLSKSNHEVIIGRDLIRRWVLQTMRPTAEFQWGGAEQVIVSSLDTGPVHREDGVIRDDWVTLRVRSGLVVVESKVLALQTGGIGQYVRVKKTNVVGSLLAQVVGKNVVEITE